MDLISARTERAARAARAQMEGRLADGVGAIYDRLVSVGADVEHLLDFDEDEVPEGFCEKAAEDLRSIVADIDRLVAGWHTGMLLREGALVVISGAPNAGKSSLLNALLGRSRAIVSAAPGTTRDAIEESLSLGGIPVRLVDTAGLREGVADEVEAEGIARAGRLLREADLHLRVVDSTLPPDPDLFHGLPPGRTLVVWSKADLAPAAPVAALPEGCRAVRASAKTGEGLDDLRSAMSDLLGDDNGAASDAEISQRHRDCLVSAREQVVAAADCLERDAEGLALAAQRIAVGADDIGRVTGRVWSDELLDAIFGRFCVGK
jgi:tRNA modification GTPase